MTKFGKCIACQADADQFTSKLVKIKRPYLVISITYEENLRGIEKLIQRATNSYFKNVFQFQRLRDHNGPSIEVQQFGLRSLVESRLTEMITSIQ